MKETYDREMTTEEKLRETQDYVKRLRKQLNDTEGDAMRYRRMRMLEVVIMAEDGAKYLKGHDLDEYLDSLPTRKGPISRADLLKELTPALNNLFGVEYEKYAVEHADKLAELYDREAVLNVKA